MSNLRVTGALGIVTDQDAATQSRTRLTVVIGFNRRITARDRLVAKTSLSGFSGQHWVPIKLPADQELQKIDAVKPTLSFDLGNSGTIVAVEIKSTVTIGADGPVVGSASARLDL